MASSIRKLRTYRVETNEPKRPERKKDKLIPFLKTPDRLSFAHLAKILTRGERLAMLNAVDRLKGRVRVLIELALFSNFQFVRLAAIQNLKGDPEALIEIAKFCHYDDTRASAVDELAANSDALVDVACSSLFSLTRLDAVNLLIDTDALTVIASRSPNKDSRNASLERISYNLPALKKVAEESAYRSARTAALAGLSSDVRSLCSLVLSKNPEIKKEAAAKLSGFVDNVNDTDALIEIAKISSNEDARFIAVGRLSADPWALRTVINGSQYSDSKGAALMLLSDMVSNLSEPEILSDIAILSPYPDCRSAAIERLAGQSNPLLSIASRSKYKDSREQALANLREDVDALKSVSRLSRYRDTRKKAHTLVSKPEVFEAELEKILG